MREDAPRLAGSRDGTTLWPGRLIGERFELREHVEADDCSTVWKGLDRRDRQPVAVKLLAAPYPDDLDEFLPQADAAKAVASPFVTHVRGSGLAADGQPYVVTEWADGPTLDQLLDRDGPMEWADFRPIAFAAATGLANLHEAGVTFGAVKPSNIVVPGGAPSRLAGLWHEFANDDRPPEADSFGVGPESDMYSLASTAFEALTGRRGKIDYWAMPMEARDIVMAMASPRGAERLSADVAAEMFSGRRKPPPAFKPDQASRTIKVLLRILFR